MRDGTKRRFNFNVGKTWKNQNGLNMEWVSMEGSEFLVSGDVPRVAALSRGGGWSPVDLDPPVTLESSGELFKAPCACPFPSFSLL